VDTNLRASLSPQDVQVLMHNILKFWSEILEKPNPLKLEIMDRRFDGKGNFWLKIYFAFSHNFSKENLQTSPTKFYSVFCEILGKIL
jgi:hypothetical protein